MADFFSQRGFGEPSAAQLHTMQRHRDILQDYLHEFTKTKVPSCFYQLILKTQTEMACL